MSSKDIEVMKMKRVVLIILPILLLAAGCQTTPDEPVVIGKDLEQMIEKGMSESVETPAPSEPAMDYAALCAHYGVPERFSATIAKGKLTICCDVAVELPEATALPMARVEAGRFSQEQVYALFHTLCGDTPMVLMPQEWDKTYYEQKILDIQAQMATATEASIVDSLKSVIDDFRKKHEAAPAHIDIVSSDGTLQTMDVEHDNTDAASGTKSYLDATADPYNMDNTAMLFSVNNDTHYANTSTYSFEDDDGNLQVIAPRSGSRLVFQREGNSIDFGQQGAGSALADVTALSLTGGAVDDCTLNTTPQQARKTVEQLIAQAGLDDMVIDRVTLYTSRNKELGADLEQLAQQGVDISALMGGPETQAYVVRLLRQVSGVKVESTHDSSETSMDQVSYSKEWWYEALTVAVDDKGIANLFWTGPLDITETLTENTAILPWSDIQNVFEKMMPIQYASFIDFDTDVRMDITRVSLSLQRIMERDSFSTGLVVPVWNFYGTTTMSKQVSEEETYTNTTDSGYRPLLCVNAVDGSVVDVGQGY
jgi:hypothetical protein